MTIENLQSDDLDRVVRTPSLTDPKKITADELYGAVARCESLDQLKALWESRLLALAKAHPDFAKLKLYVNDRKVILISPLKRN